MDTSGISALLNDPKALEQALGAVSALLGSDNVQGQETAPTDRIQTMIPLPISCSVPCRS